MPVKGGYLLAAGGGAVLLYAGMKGYSIPTVTRNILTGDPTKITTTAYPIETAAAAFTADASGAVAAHGTTGAIGSQIAEDARGCVGGSYVWGGAPGSGKGNWDCSSMCNAVIGRDLGLAIPMFKPGTYHGQSHGPNTLVWIVWPGCFTIKRRDAAPGDLAIWETHMGIIVDNGEHMVSALDVKDGTKLTTIKGGAPFAEVLVVRRLKAVTPGGGHRG